jgi:hypothetical protein
MPTSTPPSGTTGKLIVLDTSGTSSHLLVQGGQATAGEIDVNGTSSSALSLLAGSTISATVVNVQGGLRNQGGTIIGRVATNQPAVSDPMSGLPRPAKPSATCPGSACPGGSTFTTGTYNISPGYYTAVLNVNSGATVCLSPGIYWIDAGWTVNGNASLRPYGSSGCPTLPPGVTDPGVLLYFDNGILQINSGSDLTRLAAMATGPYLGLLYWQVSSASVYVNGGFKGGAWYEPGGAVTLNSGASITAPWIIAKNVTLNAQATIGDG